MHLLVIYLRIYTRHRHLSFLSSLGLCCLNLRLNLNLNPRLNLRLNLSWPHLMIHAPMPSTNKEYEQNFFLVRSLLCLLFSDSERLITFKDESVITPKTPSGNFEHFSLYIMYTHNIYEIMFQLHYLRAFHTITTMHNSAKFHRAKFIDLDIIDLEWIGMPLLSNALG